MADEVDVENTFVGFIAATLYPNGTAQQSAVGFGCQTFRGWPSRAQFDAAKANNIALVSVAARNGVERNTTRFPLVWKDAILPVHTITAEVENNIITLGGTVATPQNVIVLVGQTGVYSYGVQSGNSLSAIASALATLVARDFPGTSSAGPVITVAGTGKEVVCRIASQGTAIQEVKRQLKSFQITIWTPPYPDSTRDADYYRYSVAKVIDLALGGLIRMALPDGTYGMVQYERTITMDTAQAEGLYRRDLFYSVEYGTINSQVYAEVGVMQATLQGSTIAPVPDNAPVRETNV